MKKALIFGMMVVTTVACKKKGCIDPDALNYDAAAEKNNNTCQYEIGAYRDSFLGNFQVVDSAYIVENFSEAKAYTLLITTGGTVRDTILLSNLSDSGKSFIAVITGSNFYIPSQEVDATHTLSGSGNYSSGKIVLQTYSADSINGDITHRIEGTK